MIALLWWWACAGPSVPDRTDPCGGCPSSEVCLAGRDGPARCAAPRGCEDWIALGGCGDRTTALLCAAAVCPPPADHTGADGDGGSAAVGPHEVACTEDAEGVHRAVWCGP